MSMGGFSHRFESEADEYVEDTQSCLEALGEGPWSLQRDPDVGCI